MMVDLWFALTCAMFAAYVVLDGYDLGAGIVAPFVAKNDRERRAVIDTILPFWDGNEVFLVAGGATLYLAFPRLFPAFVSGFYLPVMMVLWLLMLRGLGIEMRHKLDQPLWNELWDGAFFVSGLLLVFFFGAAMGNVVRGVSVDEHGTFFAPLWTNLRVGEHVGILDWYTITVGLTAVVLLGRHGALRLAARALTPDGAVAERARQVASRLFVPSIALALIASIATFQVQPHVLSGLSARPWTAVFALGAGAGLGLSGFFARTSTPRARERAFWASSVALAALFACACVGVHPYGLLARVASRSVLASEAAADPYALIVGLAWWLPGMGGVVAYSVFAHRRLLAGAEGGGRMRA
jgi:cytochrome d ubiquinol oxidase subunit II